jgi:predicted NBD/HSP70 family sugar kinase
MYLGIDIGGTKTLVATLTDSGEIRKKRRFPTSKDYDQFLANLDAQLKELDIAGEFDTCAAVPGLLDRASGTVRSLGNLPWRDKAIRDDISKLVGSKRVIIENDAKLAGLSEAILLKDVYTRVLYITVSTGIGFSFIAGGTIDTSFGDAGGRALLLEHDGSMMPWEDFASGRAIVGRYGKKASEITDEATWREISHDLARGLIQLIATVQPEVIVVGGSVGVYFEKYGNLLTEALREYPMPLVALPKIVGARRPEEAVIYGCYDLIKQAGDENDNS